MDNENMTVQTQDGLPARKKAPIKPFVIVAAALLLLAGVYFLLTARLLPEYNYRKGVSALAAYDYKTAQTAFYKAGDYKDAREKYDGIRAVYQFKYESGSDFDPERTLYLYDASGVLYKEVLVDAEGESYPTEYTYDAYGRLIKKDSVRPTDTGTVEYAYDGSGNCVKEVRTAENGEKTVTEWVYDENGNMIKEIIPFSDGTKRTVEYTYGEDGDLQKEVYTGTDGEVRRTVTHTYGERSERIETEETTYTGETERTVEEMTYDRRGNLQKSVRTYADGTTDTLENTYDRKNELIRTVRITAGDAGSAYATDDRFFYDEGGNLIREEFACSFGGDPLYAFTIAYADLLYFKAPPEKIAVPNDKTQPAAVETDLAADDFAAYERGTDALARGDYAAARAAFYQAGGYKDAAEQYKSILALCQKEVCTTSGGEKTVTERVFDESGNTVKETVTEFVSGDDENGYTTVSEWIYDENGRLIKETYPGLFVGVEFTVEYTYDERGNLIREIRTETSLDYDTDPVSETVTHTVRTYTYDEGGDKPKACETAYDGAEARSNRFDTEYTYDDKGNCIKDVCTYYPLGNQCVTEYTYDESGNLIKREEYTEEYAEPVSREYLYEYDGDGNLKREVYTDSSGGWSVCEYAYDKYGNCTEETYAVYTGHQTVTRHTYDADGNRVKTTETYSTGKTSTTVYSDFLCFAAK